MVIAAIDSENYKFDTESRTWKPLFGSEDFVIGHYIDEEGYEFISYNNQEFWDLLLQRAEELAKKKKPLHIYAHYMANDFFRILHNVNRRVNLEYCSPSPFIVKIHWEPTTDNSLDPTATMFLDTMQFYKGSLEDMADELKFEHQKLEMPKEIPDLMLKEALIPYVKVDTKIVLEIMLKVKDTCNRMNMRPNRLCTIGQLAGNYMLNWLKKDENAADILIRGKKSYLLGEFVHPTKCANKHILNSLRLGRVEVYQSGLHKDVTQIDLNSLFSYAAINMPIPNLYTERVFKAPDKSVLTKYGVSQVVIKVPKCSIGILPVRLEDEEEYFPTTEGCIIIGTYTHHELNYAIKNGYELLEILWSVTYDLSTKTNPFKLYVEHIYDERKKTQKDTFENWFYKQILNHGWGKLAMHRDFYTMCEADMNDEQKYCEDGYEVVDRIGHMQLYKKVLPFTMHRRYAPILYSYITSWARVYHTQFLKRLPYESLLYCDTDSIIYKSIFYSHDNFIYSENIGNWKRVGTYDKLYIYGKKAYGNEQFVKLSGVQQQYLKRDDGTIDYNKFLQGKFTAIQMHNISPESFFKAGQLYTKDIDLHEMQQKFQQRQQELATRCMFVDEYDLKSNPILITTAEKYGGISVRENIQGDGVQHSQRVHVHAVVTNPVSDNK